MRQNQRRQTFGRLRNNADVICLARNGKNEVTILNATREVIMFQYPSTYVIIIM